MKQLELGFASERDTAVLLDPAIQDKVVTLMAKAVLAVVVEAEELGGRDDDAGAIEQQDRTTAPGAEGGGLHATVLGQASP